MSTLSSEGVSATCRRAWRQLARHRVVDGFDAHNGTETGGLVPLWQLNIDSPNARHGERYEATTEVELVDALNSLGEPLGAFTFIDLGCGKGRTLIVAAQMQFKQIIGVEFARELADIATRNLARLNVPHASVLHADAAAFAFPAGDMVIYLYNPFSEEVLSRVLDNLRSSSIGTLYVIYKAPRCARLLDDCGFLERRSRPPGAPHIEVWHGHLRTDLDPKATP